MGAPHRVLVALCFLCNLSTFAQQSKPLLPDPNLTPGDVFEVTIQDICVPGYSKKVRDVPVHLKKQAYARYGITSWEPGDYQLDHLIPLSLGGSNSIRNLWPQSTTTSPWNAHVKDALERRLHNLVCAGQLDLKTAQRAIAENWIDAYKKYVAKAPPASEVREPQSSPESATADEVWLNERSSRYWKPGSRFYGKTRHGRFMSELDALDAGYLPAGGTGY